MTRKIEGNTPTNPNLKDKRFLWYPLGVCGAIIAFTLFVINWARC